MSAERPPDGVDQLLDLLVGHALISGWGHGLCHGVILLVKNSSGIASV